MKQVKQKKAPAQWCELHIVPPAGWAEALAGYLFEVGAGAVEERIEKGRPMLVSHLPQDEKLNGRIAMLGDYFAQAARISGEKGLPKITFRKIDDRPWAADARRSFKPVLIVPGVKIAPGWKDVKKKPGERILRIDPGEAFGTGLHSSTKLCAKLMVEAISMFDSPRLLDVGTGTGILAMVAIAKGAGEVVANDVDPKAVEVAAENFKINACVVKLTGTPVEKMRKKFNIIAANILLEELERLAPYLAKRTLPGGVIVMSGLLTTQADQIKKRMKEINTGKLWKEKRSGEWCALAFIKP